MVINTGLHQIIKNQKNLSHLTFRRNEPLFVENETSKGLFCIESGNVKIFKNEPNDEERILHLASKGEILGLHSVVNSHPYSNSAVAISETYTSFISAEDFMKMVDANNTYKLLVMKSLCSRIDSMEDHIVRISEKMTDERFADTLLLLLDKYGVNTSKELNIHLSIDDLASFTCTSKSYMKKIISEFSHRGLIKFSDSSIFVLDIPQIKLIATPVQQTLES
jgi:CRP-like cAMP-binding protein